MRPSELFMKKTGQTGLYNIQVINNIPSIMKRGLLSNERAVRVNHISIAMNEVQRRREHVRVPNGLKLHQYANLYFDPRNPMLSSRRDQNENICILKFDCSVLDLEGVIVSDRNASSEYAAFYPSKIGLECIDFEIVYARYWTDENYYIQMKKKSMKCAEVLVPHQIPYAFVTSAAVWNQNAAARLSDTGFGRDIKIVPEIYF